MSTLEEKKDSLIIEYFELFDKMQEYQKNMNKFISTGLFDFSYIRSRSFDSDVISFIHVPKEIEPKITIDLDEKKCLYNVKEAENVNLKNKSKESILTSKKETEMHKQDPIYWFGLLPSSDLKSAQSNFKQAIFQAAENE
eukprot:gene2700-3896_t